MINFLKKFQTNKPKDSPKVEEKEQVHGFNSILYDNTTFDLYNPDDLIIKKGNAVYQNMMHDDQVKAILAFKKSAVLSRSFNFEIEDDSHQKIADFFYTVLDQMNGSFSDVQKKILSAFQNGFSLSEKNYKIIQFENKPYWGIKDIKLKPWDTFVFEIDKFGNIFKLKQMNGIYDDIIVPINKMIHFVHQSDINPFYGESDLRACYRAYWSKDITIRFMNVHLERHGSGIIVVTPEEGSDKSTHMKSTLLSILKRLTVGTNIVMPEKYKLEMHQPQKTDAFEQSIAIHDKAIAKSMLVPNLLGLSEQGNTGSYSQSQTQFDVFLWVIEEICNSLEECYNEQLFKELALWNFGTDEFPHFQFDPMTESKKNELAKTWSELLQKSAVTNTVKDEQFTRSLIGYPELDEDELEPPDEEIPPEPIPEPVPEEEPLEEPPKSEEKPEKKEFAANTNSTWLKRVNFERIERTFDTIEETLINDLNQTLYDIKLSIEKQIRKIVGERSLGNVELKEFDSLSIPNTLKNNIQKILNVNLEKVFTDSYDEAGKELPEKNFVMGTTEKTKLKMKRFLKTRAYLISLNLNNDIVNDIIQLLQNGIIYDKSLKTMITDIMNNSKIKSLLPETTVKAKTLRVENIVRTNVAMAVNEARKTFFEQDDLKGFIRAYEYSAILDSRVSDICESLNGKIRRDWGSYTPPNHFQCRSILIPITVVDDWDGKESNIQSSVKPLEGFK